MPAKQPAMSPSDTPVEAVLDQTVGPRRAEADELVSLFAEISGEKPVVWAGRIIGFGEYQYRYASGHSGRAPILAFATGKNHHTVYLVSNYAERWPELLARLGSYRTSKACLYLTRLSRVDTSVLRELLMLSHAITLQEAVSE